MICSALGFAALGYQSCQAGRSAVQENVVWIENRHTVRMSVCVCVCVMVHSKDIIKKEFEGKEN